MLLDTIDYQVDLIRYRDHNNILNSPLTKAVGNNIRDNNNNVNNNTCTDTWYTAHIGAYRVPLTHWFQEIILQNHKHKVPIPGSSATPAEFCWTRKPFSDESIKLNCIIHYNHVIIIRRWQCVRIFYETIAIIILVANLGETW